MNSTHHQLLFGVLALQMDLITQSQFAEACTIWASQKDRDLRDLLADRGWIRLQDRSDIDRLMSRRVERHGGDVVASLHEAGRDPRVHGSLASIQVDDIHQSLAPDSWPRRLSLLATQAPGPESLGRYTLSHLHATGGIGRVWLAHDATLRRDVALKELRPDRIANSVIQSRFLREAQVTGQLEHPGIVPIYEVGRRPDDESPYYTMRFIRGRTLAEAADAYHRHHRNTEDGPLEFRKLLTAFIGICNAVAFAHSRGVLHRDLKPQNIVLGSFGEVMVLDWGLARVMEESESGPTYVDLESTDDADATRAGQVLGTPAYMSPEQASGKLELLGQATDVYGLGAILYHLIANRPPFEGSSQSDVVRRVKEESPPTLREVGADCPPPIEAVCLKALARETKDRYPSATMLAEEVQRWLADEPVQAFSDPLSVRVGRWMRRHRSIVTAASVFLLCSMIALAGVAAVVWRQERETDRQLARTADFASLIVEAADAARGNADQVRISMAQKGVTQVRELRRERPEDGRLAVTLARLLQFDATAKRLSRRYAEAEANLIEAISILAPFLAKEPGNQTYRSVSASSHFNLGAVQHQMGKRRDAAANHTRAMELHGRPPRFDVVARFNQAVAVSELTLVHFGWKPMKEVERASREAAELLEGVAEDSRLGEAPIARLLQCAALNRAAQCLCELEQPVKALPLLEKSALVMDQLVAARPKDRDVLHFRAHCWFGRATACAAIKGREDDAFNAYENGLKLWTPLSAEWPHHDAYRFMIVQLLTSRADLHRIQGHRQEAESDISTAERTLSSLPKESQTAVEYHLSRAHLAELKARLAMGAKDAPQAKFRLAAARDAYAALLKVDADNELARKYLAKLESDARAIGGE